ncbi:MAG TPA: ABC transporter permease [Patescibacteria group bacterium]|nr:ABC transporter permease [Patescibacteria group bacterium]
MKFLPLKLAIASLKRNRGRTMLTVLGVVIGIMAVITVMSAGDGLHAYLVGQIQTFGTDLIQTEIKVPNTGHVSTENAQGLAMGIQVTTLTLDDMAAIDKLPNIKASYATVLGQEIISFENENKQTLIWGASAAFDQIDASNVEQGRFFTDEEDKGLAQVVVLGVTVKEKIFGDQEAFDQMVKIGKLKFRVIGVMEKRGSIAFFDMDNMVYLPIQTLQKKIMGINNLMSITSQVYDKNLFDQTSAEITSLLRQRHDIMTDNKDKDDFNVMTMAEALDIYNTIFGALGLLLGAIAGISLIVGGVGIMNIMYVSVTERTYEIGLRKAVGATNTNILWQFLWEAMVITFFGALIGFLFGVGLSFLIAFGASALGFSWAFVVSPNAVILAIGATLGIGLTFGVFPAIAAARLEPVTALRKTK